MSETIYMNATDGRKVGGRYWDEATQKYVNADGMSLDQADALPAVESELARLTALAAQLQAQRATKDEVVVDGDDPPPSEYHQRKAWVIRHGRTVTGNPSKPDLEVLVQEVLTNSKQE